MLNVFDFADALADPDVQALIARREQARKEKNWTLADDIRDQLAARGVTVRDRGIRP